MHFFLKKNIIIITLTVSCVLFLINCNGTRVVVEKCPSHKSSQSVYHAVKGPPPWAPAHGYRAKHRYRYYPSSHVYYDTGRSLYFYYSNGDWRMSVSLPSRIRIAVNDFVALEMNSDKPYKYHSDVKKKYPPGKVKIKHKNKKNKNKWKG
jgi:hypothetical protein